MKTYTVCEAVDNNVAEDRLHKLKSIRSLLVSLTLGQNLSTAIQVIMPIRKKKLSKLLSSL